MGSEACAGLAGDKTSHGHRITHVGLDVHKEGIVVTLAEGGLRVEIWEYSRIANTVRLWIA